jgi:hypothetical protein
MRGEGQAEEGVNERHQGMAVVYGGDPVHVRDRVPMHS